MTDFGSDSTPRAEIRDPYEGSQSLNRYTGHLLAIILFLAPALTIWFFMGYGPAIFYGGALFALTIKIQRTTTVSVVERAGLFWDVKVPNPYFFGIRLIWPLIDRVVHEDDFLQKEVRLFMQEKKDAKGNVVSTEPIQIDFAGLTTIGDTDELASAGGASAPVDASAWYQLGNPEDIESGNWKEIRKQVYLYVYRVRFEERASRVAEIFHNALRPILESCTLTYAQKHSIDLSKQGARDAGEALAEIGIYPFPKKGITIRDIAIPPYLVELRERVIRGQVDAEERNNLYRSFHEPLVKMKETLEKSGMKFDDNQLMAFFLNQKILEMLGTTKSNISLVSPNVEGMLKTFNVGSATPSPTPTTAGSTAP